MFGMTHNHDIGDHGRVRGCFWKNICFRGKLGFNLKEGFVPGGLGSWKLPKSQAIYITMTSLGWWPRHHCDSWW